MRKLWISAFVLWGLFACSSGEGAESTSLSHVRVITSQALTREQEQLMRDADSLLIMIPGVSSGDLDNRCRFLEQIRAQGGHDLAIFYDWEEKNPLRRIVFPTAVNPAAARLIDLCEAFQTNGKPIDLLAHSAGTVVVNKAAIFAREKGSPVRFRHVLFLGTALAFDEPLQELKDISSGVLNVHSDQDKVNRNINDQAGRLDALDGDAYNNRRIDHSLSGRIMRHYTFLSPNPENWFSYGSYLSTGQWPQPDSSVPTKDARPGQLHRLTMWVKEHPSEQLGVISDLLPQWIHSPEPDMQYYAAILIGLLSVKSLGPVMRELAGDEQTPAYVRKELYQALGNFEDGTYIPFLRTAYKSDPKCSAEIRDILRELKRKRVERKRTNEYE